MSLRRVFEALNFLILFIRVTLVFMVFFFQLEFNFSYSRKLEVNIYAPNSLAHVSNGLIV